MKNALPISLNDLESIQQRLTLLESSVSKTIGFPDYSNAEEITITIDDGYTVQKNGWISVRCGSSGNVTVNGVSVAIARTYGDAWAYAQQSIFPVSEGDIVETTGTDRTNYVWFIPCK